MRAFSSAVVVLTLLSTGCASTPPAPAPTADEATAATSPADSGSAESTEKAAVEPCPEDDDACRADRVDMSFGWLKLGLDEQNVVRELGVPFRNTAQGLMEASGEWLFQWGYPSRGVNVDMVSDTEDGPLTVGGFTLVAPCTLKNDKGLGIGSSEVDVRAAYPGLGDPHFDTAGEQFIAGSIFGGINFGFEDGKVVIIFVGAGAE